MAWPLVNQSVALAEVCNKPVELHRSETIGLCWARTWMAYLADGVANY